MKGKYPKISIVTPNFNHSVWLSRTIESVINQEYPNLEYIIIDGGSTDGSVEVIKKYEKHITFWGSGKDKGLYDAIQKGFDKSTGDIMGWLNSDDILFPGALKNIGLIFNEYKNIHWLSSNHCCINEQDEIVHNMQLGQINHLKLLQGKGLIQQESTYWKRELWIKAGGYISQKYNLAADFELWLRFSKLARLYPVMTCFSGFRYRSKNQKTLDQREAYNEEMHEIEKEYELALSDDVNYARYLMFQRLKTIPILRRYLFNRVSREFAKKCLDLAPYLYFDRKNNGFIFSKK